MLAQEIVDQDKRRLSRIMMKRADAKIGAGSRRKDCRQVGIGSGDNGCARNGVTDDPPAKSGGLSVRGDNLSQEIRNEHPLQMRALLAPHRADGSNQLAIAAAYLYHCAYSARAVVAVIGHGTHGDLRARHCHHTPNYIDHALPRWYSLRSRPDSAQGLRRAGGY